MKYTIRKIHKDDALRLMGEGYLRNLGIVHFKPFPDMTYFTLNHTDWWEINKHYTQITLKDIQNKTINFTSLYEKLLSKR